MCLYFVKFINIVEKLLNVCNVRGIADPLDDFLKCRDVRAPLICFFLTNGKFFNMLRTLLILENILRNTEKIKATNMMKGCWSLLMIFVILVVKMLFGASGKSAKYPRNTAKDLWSFRNVYQDSWTSAIFSEILRSFRNICEAPWTSAGSRDFCNVKILQSILNFCEVSWTSAVFWTSPKLHEL